MEIQELKNSYYDYISKVPSGIQIIIAKLKENNLEEAFTGLADLAEGLSALLKIEEALGTAGYTINSNIANVVELYEEINNALEMQDTLLVTDILEFELYPLFSSSTEWIFINGGVE